MDRLLQALLMAALDAELARRDKHEEQRLARARRRPTAKRELRPQTSSCLASRRSVTTGVSEVVNSSARLIPRQPSADATARGVTHTTGIIAAAQQRATFGHPWTQ